MRDKPNFGKEEYWATGYETWTRRFDDCDGMNNLIYVLARLSGLSSIVLWCVIGNTSVGGHFWLAYSSPKTGKLYTIDATYHPDFTSIKKRKPFKLDDNKYKNIWFIFNEEHIFKEK